MLIIFDFFLRLSKALGNMMILLSDITPISSNMLPIGSSSFFTVCLHDMRETGLIVILSVME